MPIVERFAPPANLPDLNSIPGALEEWHTAVCRWFDWSIRADSPKVRPGPFQFYNPAWFDPGGWVVEQAITWNAFPKELLRRFDRETALKEADTLWPLYRYSTRMANEHVDRREYPSLFTTYFRPQDEYCEWRVERESKTGPIRRVTFTSEPPELWQAAFGGAIPGDPAENTFTGDPDIVVKRYRQITGAAVRREDLVAARLITGPGGDVAVAGGYNINNKWNTTHGIVHLCSPPNALLAEIKLAADATVLRRTRAGHLLVEPEALICCAQFGGVNRNSDPTIGATVNAVARLGAFVTLKDPVGLYMDHIDLSGWECPDKKPVTDCVQIVRGTPGMIERLVIEVPKNRAFSVSDIRIGGEPIRYGGQIAECVTVKLTAIANVLERPVRNEPVECRGACYFKPGDRNATTLRANSPGRGRVRAFRDEGTEEVRAPRGNRRGHKRAAPLVKRVAKIVKE